MKVKWSCLTPKYLQMRHSIQLFSLPILMMPKFKLFMKWISYKEYFILNIWFSKRNIISKRYQINVIWIQLITFFCNTSSFRSLFDICFYWVKTCNLQVPCEQFTWAENSWSLQLKDIWLNFNPSLEILFPLVSSILTSFAHFLQNPILQINRK